ncbi:TMEM175 family protein [Brevundimonas sp.]|jgi:hypothetical protein|uniref:TMEM175 family protein n=1 Tax=Brevundimonas sp. TaxID=1871086 RepID=UPI00262061B8|nr:TMEM175 family protein [Brevundimonas sp.]
MDQPVEDREASRRLDAFVDASFAFAVTLLVIAGAEPLRSFDDLLGALSRIPAFAVGFALVTLFWSAHRGFGKLTPVRDGRSTLISLAIVFTVLIYVFPLRLLTESGVGWMSGGLLPGRELVRSLDDLRGIFAAYGVGFAFLSALFVALNQSGRATAPTAGARAQLGRARDIWLLCSVSGLLSAGVALSPATAAAPWLPGVCYWIIPIGIGLMGLARRKAVPVPTDPEPS